MQIKQEMAGCLDFLQSVYGVFGFTFQLCLSTRPEKYLGDIKVWEEAEKVSAVILGKSLLLVGKSFICGEWASIELLFRRIYDCIRIYGRLALAFLAITC